jgi:crotonobetainyl-CoA:carnitine CoA-transferase CaiB-like acyl-CoA transferase
MPLPLAGIRVVDFGRFIAAPYCGMLLADMGADCVRVERREGGEDRRVGPVTQSGAGGLFLNLNRNKRGMTLDLGHARSREILEPLVRWADIAIVNLPLTQMTRLGLDYDSLCLLKRDIILVMASAFGPDGPHAERVGFDSVAQAASGAMSLTGFPGAPVRSVVPFADYGTALHAAFGAMVALYQRQQTGRGQLIDVSLLATSVAFMQPYLAERAATLVRRGQLGNASFWGAPNDTYRTSDGWIMVPTIGDWMFVRWARLMGRDDFIADPRFSDDSRRADHYQAINEVMSGWCAARSTNEALGELQRARIPCGPVYNLDQVLADPQVAARGLLQEVGYQPGDAPVKLSAAAVRLGAQGASSPEPARLRPAPALGEHTDEILGELGFTARQIAEFRAAKLI